MAEDLRYLNAAGDGAPETAATERLPTLLPPHAADGQQPLVGASAAFNCAAIPKNLIEAELFGVERGAFTGNLWELQNLVERRVIASDPSELINLPHLFRGEPLPAELLESAPQTAGWLERLGVAGKRPLPLARLKAELLNEALARSRGNMAATARLLGLSRARFAYRHRRVKRNLD